MKFFDISANRSKLIRLVIAAICVFSICAVAKEKEPKVSELLKDANELMTQAQEAYVAGEGKQAIELYRKAIDEIVRVERENPRRVSSSEFAPLRFRKALCETEIDRIMLDDVSSSARTVAVTDTSALEAKRAERKKAAETNNVPDVSFKLAAKTESGAQAPVAEIPEDGADGAAKGEVNVADELEWAKDMLSVDRFDDAEVSLLKVLKAAPESRDARVLMALSRLQQGKHNDAAVVLDDLLADNPRDETTLLLAAGAHAANGSYAKAMDALDKAMKANPQRPAGYYNMAWLLLDINPVKTDEPEMYYRKAVELGGTRDLDLERRLGIKSE
ncbi:MAG: tetratricopeptide repeat protein [Kiritimatiellae bacterium]|nr:tetratricopeptide repeat protein [Kiritimatiellia bacterium]